MRQKTTITYLEHNMLACNRINRAIASQLQQFFVWETDYVFLAEYLASIA